MEPENRERRSRVVVEPLPDWVPVERLLGPTFQLYKGENGVRAEALLPLHEAAYVASRLRGLGLDGLPLEVRLSPEPARPVVRRARLEDARARRETTPGFLHPKARAQGEGRYSLTPELLALNMGKLAAGWRVVDACCGSGGNTLGFARAGCSVLAIEQDEQRLADAKHNAEVYRVAERIRFLAGDALALVPTLTADLLFIDPPWGEHYDKRCCARGDFPLLDQLLSSPLSGYREVWMKLPASFATAGIPGAVPSAWFGEAAGDRDRIKFVLLRLSRNGRKT